MPKCTVALELDVQDISPAGSITDVAKFLREKVVTPDDGPYVEW
jgi:hypothetical protein